MFQYNNEKKYPENNMVPLSDRKGFALKNKPVNRPEEN